MAKWFDKIEEAADFARSKMLEDRQVTFAPARVKDPDSGEYREGWTVDYSRVCVPKVPPVFPPPTEGGICA